jgi:hypothetical protein
VEPHREQAALLFIKHRLHFEACFPFFVAKDRYRHQITVPVFPGYVFVGTNGHPWWPLQRAHGVVKVLLQAGGQQPASLPISFVKEIERLILPRPDRSLPVGTKVTVLRQGMWQGREAFIKWSEHDRVALLFEILGRECEKSFLMPTRSRSYPEV